ncbi:MAG: hypothetical protein ACRD1R_18775 [Acidobacteriota bacterium]
MRQVDGIIVAPKDAHTAIPMIREANPDINFIFSSSDQMLPPIASGLKRLGKWKRVGEEGHVLLGAFDGDATAYRMLVQGSGCRQRSGSLLRERRRRSGDPGYDRGQGKCLPSSRTRAS